MTTATRTDPDRRRGTRRAHALQLAATLATCGALLAGCVYYPAAPVPGPSTFDRSWDAALGAAADAGVQVSAADRARGLISGSKGGAPVQISLTQQADGSVRVAFDASASPETNPTLAERLNAAYQRRMGR